MCGSCGSSSHCWGRETEEHWCGCYGLSLGASWGFRMLTASHCLPAVDVLRTSWTSCCCCSVTRSCLALCDPVNCSLPGSFAIFRSLLKFTSFESVMPSNHLILCCPLLLLPSIYPSIRVFPMSQFLASDGQSIGVLASESVLSMNIQGWFPLGLTGLTFLLSKGLARVFSSTTIWKHQFLDAQTSLWSNSHIRTFPRSPAGHHLPWQRDTAKFCFCRGREATISLFMNSFIHPYLLAAWWAQKVRPVQGGAGVSWACGIPIWAQKQSNPLGQKLVYQAPTTGAWPRWHGPLPGPSDA